MGYLNNAGLSYFFGKLKTIFAPISHGHGGATQSAAGFMSAADKKKLDGIAEGANKYSLPTATSNVLGGVKTGANITNNSGVLSVTAANVTNALGYTPPKQDTNTWRGVQNNLTSDATDQSLSAAQGKVLKGLVDGKAPSGHTHDDRYYTESEIDSKLSGKANNHSHPYLPLAGGTMSGTITFAAIGDKGTSAGLAFSGSTDGAGIYYQTTAGDQGNLVLNLTDDDNCYLQIAKNGAFKSYFSPDGVFHGSVAGNASSASSVAWSNVTGKPSTFTPAGHTHTKSQITDFPALGTAAAKNVRTLTARGSSGWKNTATDQQYVPDMSFIANWNGSYDGTGSNLVYCCMGAFGTIVTKNTSDYAVAGHTHNYAGSSSAGGAATSANKVNAALTINLNGTSQGAWDGSSAKSISITAASVGATSVTISRW